MWIDVPIGFVQDLLYKIPTKKIKGAKKDRSGAEIYKVSDIVRICDLTSHAFDQSIWSLEHLIFVNLFAHRGHWGEPSPC